MAGQIGNAIAAYNSAARKMGAPGMEAREVSGSSFSDLLKQAVDQAISTGETAEKQSTSAAVTGKTDLTQVVTAVTAAEVTVQTVTAVRDRVVAAYQEILRMPI